MKTKSNFSEIFFGRSVKQPGSGLRAVLIALLVVLGMGEMRASDSYYAKLTATASPSGAGMVYVSGSTTDSPQYVADSHQGQNDSGSSGGSVTFYGYAKAQRGYVFDHWDNAGATSTDMPIQVSRTASTTKNKESAATVYSNLTAYFVANPSITGGVTYAAATNGSYTIDYDLLEAGDDPVAPVANFVTYNTDIVTLTATADEGYAFAGWSFNGSIVSYKNPMVISFTEATTVQAVFSTAGTFMVDQADAFANLSDALTAANALASTEPVVVPLADYTVPAGNYTIASGVTLLVPYESTYAFDTIPSTVTKGTPSRSVYRTLTLGNGVIINVNGSICVNAKMCLTMGYNGSAMNGYGLIDMKTGSQVILNSGSNCYVWGFVIGDGTITAESGSTIHEAFQFKHRGGNALSAIAGWSTEEHKVFPINQYYVQNIEPAITIKKGAKEKVYTGVHNVNEATSIDFIGQDGLFNLTGNNAYLVKKYDVLKDRQTYSLYGDATIGSITFGMNGFSKESKDYTLPITNNMTLNIESGTTTIQYQTAILPDVQISIADDATIIATNNCYIYDSLGWKGAYAYANDYDKETATSAQIAPVVFRHGGLKYNRKTDKLRDVTVDVQGELKGILYTTAGGANIKSSGNGTVTLSGDRSETETYQAGQNGTTAVFDTLPITSAQLHNASSFYSGYSSFGDFEYLTTADAEANTTIRYVNGHWGWVGIWKDTDGTTTLGVANKSAESQLAAAAPEPTRTGYTATWTPVRDAANQEVVYTLSWVETMYEVAASGGANGSASPASVSNVGIVTASGDITATPNTGYQFASWTLPEGVTAATGYTATSNPIRINTISDNTITANWSPVNYSITYEGLEGATNSNPATYTIETPTITLADPGTRANYVFAGWTCNGEDLTEIALGSTGNKTLTANWTFVLNDNSNEASYYDYIRDNLDDVTVHSVTYSRTFRQGYWATLTLPFDVNRGTMTSQKLMSSIYEFKYATGSASNEDGGITLYFSKAIQMKAGQCYIVNATAALAAKSSFTFRNVTFHLDNDNVASLESASDYDNLNASPTTEGNIELVGTLRKGILSGGETYMGLKDNKIYYPNTTVGNTVLAYRGLFRIVSGESMPVRFRMVVDGEDMGELEIGNGELYDADGDRQACRAPSSKFIRDGVLYIERDGAIYTVTGERVR